MMTSKDTRPEVTGRPTVTGRERREACVSARGAPAMCPGRRLVRITAVPAAVIVLAAVLLATHLVSVDWLPALHTYGLSFGTNYHYCSVDLAGGHLAAGCQSAH